MRIRVPLDKDAGVSIHIKSYWLSLVAIVDECIKGFADKHYAGDTFVCIVNDDEIDQSDKW